MSNRCSGCQRGPRLIYRNESLGETLFGRSLSRVIAEAVRGRRSVGHAREQIEALAAQAGVDVTLRCLNTSIRTVIAEGLGGGYDLIYSAGLFDYLKDSAARAAGARLVAALAPGGRAVIGNFGPANPDRPLMELILDWPLLHRTAGDLYRLFGEIGTDVTIEREATGVNWFAVISA